MKKYNFKIKHIIEELGLPKATKFKGYVVHLIETDEFLLNANYKLEDTIGYMWTKIPEMAKIYKKREKAIKEVKEVKEYNKYGVTLCLLLDIGEQYIVMPENEALEIIKLQIN